jgi:hypothetical protein
VIRAGLRVKPMTMVGFELCIVVQQQIDGIALVCSYIGCMTSKSAQSESAQLFSAGSEGTSGHL